MLSAATLLTFSVLALGLAITPGPNMLYLVSRSVAQGPRAGLVSLAGCQAGSLVIMLGAAAGVTAALLAIPYAYDVLRLGGAAYLAWLAWQSIRPGGQPLFAPRALPPERDGKLFAVGMATALLNPKVAIFYVAVMPPFMDPALGSLFWQGVTLGLVQITVATLADAALVVGAGGVARFFTRRPRWAALQRWIMGGALGGLAVSLALQSKR
ncbi:lysine transporter LysE [Pseudoroseomonas deserti]|uniref:Lysine transporter LysE n=1 Tax=Teichococcus deserti TaxID=1817963 RepID=A0A1V2GV18_9PROT|nr:LysE family translocator [Pseudoroseomonas deserti]ONG46213.1 lysine transporter LysE [Pseudoroseomonas deserti]